jgi:hypothetical protein
VSVDGARFGASRDDSGARVDVLGRRDRWEFSFFDFWLYKNNYVRNKRGNKQRRASAKKKAARGLLSSYLRCSPFPELTRTHPCGHPSGNKRRRRTEAHHVLALR